MKLSKAKDANRVNCIMSNEHLIRLIKPFFSISRLSTIVHPVTKKDIKLYNEQNHDENVDDEQKKI